MSILQTIKEQFKEWNNPGLNVMMANDGKQNPSVTLFFAYISFLAVLGSLLYLHFNPESPTPTLISTLVWSISVILYKMRMIDKMKFSAKDQSFELDADDEDETPTKK